ncbi:MAG: serine hydrolase [Clostridia bacterium]|nr:serine hydrolase [Clostridia bacterium]
MPTTPVKTLLYRAALPLLAPSVRGKLVTEIAGHPVTQAKQLERIFTRHHVQGGSVLLGRGEDEAVLHLSVRGNDNHRAGDDTMYRVASLTKMATTLVVLKLCGQEKLALTDEINALLPAQDSLLDGITLEMLLSHRSGLCDTPAYDRVLASGGTYLDVLHAPGAVFARPGEAFRYCNFGFGLAGCIIEQATGLPLCDAFDELLFRPLELRATLSAASLAEESIMEITRVLARRKAPGIKMTALGRQPMTAPDPLRHFGHSAGAMYADIASVGRMLRLIASGGELDGVRYLPADVIGEMMRIRSDYGEASPGMHYGLGLVIYHDEALPGRTFIGHQGFAYGCVDGAFFDAQSGDRVISLNGGASEARAGRMGLLNVDVIRWAFGKELPGWM